MEKLDPKTDGATPDIIEQNIEKMKKFFPYVFTEGKIDLDALRETLGDYADERQERYSFTWNGKSRARRIAQTPSTGTLRPCPEESVNWDTTQNLFIEGDNLEVLKLLQKSYHKKVKMIYIDPPYNTGKDFIYPDDFRDNIKNYMELTGQTDVKGRRLSSNAETSGRYHTDWLNMMYPRLKLARNLLSDDGVFFISIDDNECTNVRKLCDEVFGEECFVGQVTVLCNPKGRSQDKYLANCHEYLVIYSRSVLEKGDLNALKPPEEVEADFPLQNDKGVYRELELRNTHRDFGKHNRPNLYYPLYVDSDGSVSTESRKGAMEVFPDWDDGFEGCWTWGIDKAKAEINDLVGKKVNGNWKVYRKAYASTPGEEPTKQLKSIWSEKRHHTEKGQAAFNKLFDTKTKIFQSPKSLDVIMDAMAMTRDKDALILDFFAGSATAAHAMLAMNAKDGGKRRFVMVQLPEPCAEDSDAKKAGFATIADIGKERIRRVIKKLTSERLEKAKEEQGSLLKEAEDKPNLDLGLKVFKLDASNIKPWDADFDNLETALFDSIENIKPDRSEADVLYELLLKYGLDLAVPIEERKIAGKTVYIIGAGALIVCLDKKISLEVVEGIAGLKEELKPEVMRVVFKDAGFANDVVKTNAVQILRQAEIEDVKSL